MNKLYFRPALLIDGVHDQPLPDMAVSVMDGKIVSVAPSGKAPDGFKEVDVRGKTLMPGLINAHVHLGMVPDKAPEQRSPVELSLLIQEQLKTLLNSGVTYVRNQGTPDYYDQMAQQAVAKGLLAGPEIIPCGPALTIPGGHGAAFSGKLCTGEEDCRKAAEEIAGHGVGALKIMATGGVMTEGTNLDEAQYGPEEMRAMVDVAREHGLISSVHAHGATGMRRAVEAGITTVEHGTFMDDDILEKMLSQGTWLVPTLTAPHSIKSKGLAGGIPEHIMKKMDVVYDIRMANFRKAYKAGMKIGCGTDAGTPNNPFTKTWFELHMFIQNGVTPMDAVRIATLKTAEMLSIAQDYGSIEQGKFADLIVLEGNPLEHVETLKAPCMVLKKGRTVNG